MSYLFHTHSLWRFIDVNIRMKDEMFCINPSEFLKSLSAITSAANSLVGRANPYTKESFLLFYLNLIPHKNQKLNIWTKFITDYTFWFPFCLVFFMKAKISLYWDIISELDPQPAPFSLHVL